MGHVILIIDPDVSASASPLFHILPFRTVPKAKEAKPFGMVVDKAVEKALGSRTKGGRELPMASTSTDEIGRCGKACRAHFHQQQTINQLFS